MITIKTTHGDKHVDVEATMFGPWAVHKAWRSKNYAITHVESGMCIPPFYTEDLHKATVTRVAKALAEKFPSPKIDDAKMGEQVARLIWKVSLGNKP